MSLRNNLFYDHKFAILIGGLQLVRGLIAHTWVYTSDYTSGWRLLYGVADPLLAAITWAAVGHGVDRAEAIYKATVKDENTSLIPERSSYGLQGSL